jgi:hypothetical protein
MLQTTPSSRSERESLPTPAVYDSSSHAHVDDWRKIEGGLYESPDGQWRIANPRKLTNELRHRWLVAERNASGSGWSMHHGDHASLQDARAYVEAFEGLTPAAGSARS